MILSKACGEPADEPLGGLAMPVRAVVALLATLAVTSVAVAQSAKLKRYDTKYYVIHSDLDAQLVREAELRVTRMAEEYYERTKGFAGRITQRLPFYLFSNPADYHAAGGMPGSAGIFNGKQLMAIAGEILGDETWHVVQHEGFHQFIHAVIGGDIPIWVNEGLAEYFGEALFTGDEYIVGVVSPQRLARIKTWIAADNSAQIRAMMQTEHATWNNKLSIENYDRAWSMVHFLAHARGGKYQGAFNSFLKSVSSGQTWEAAWAASFGYGLKEFEKQWREYWLERTAEESRPLYARAAAATMTSFFARAFAQKQTFEDVDAFFAAADAGKLKCHAEDWLPPALLERFLGTARKQGRWSVSNKSGRYELLCDMPDGTRLAGTFQITPAGRVREGSVAVVPRKTPK
jgi:Protein of unknown function (DUF1570)